MTHYRATYTHPDGTAGRLDLIARTRWDAYAALFDALTDGVRAVRLLPRTA